MSDTGVGTGCDIADQCELDTLCPFYRECLTIDTELNSEDI
jgi:hypothetical protein